MAIYPSYFKLQVRWLHSLTPVTYLCTLPGIAALLGLWPRCSKRQVLQLELFRV
jgi:hypothetical protein